MDKTSKVLLKYLEKSPNHKLTIYDVDNIVKELNLSSDEIQACANYLVEHEYLEYIYSTNDQIVGVRLAHIGLHNNEFKKISFFKYLKDNWISILALIVSILSLIISLCRL